MSNYCRSTGHSFRRRQRPSSSNRGLTGYANPSPLLRPIGTSEINTSIRSQPNTTYSHIQVNTSSPMTARQFCITLPSHQIFPSVVNFPHSSSHRLFVLLFALSNIKHQITISRKKQIVITRTRIHTTNASASKPFVPDFA
jgi:hypothetical protein